MLGIDCFEILLIISILFNFINVVTFVISYLFTYDILNTCQPGDGTTRQRFALNVNK